MKFSIIALALLAFAAIGCMKVPEGTSILVTDSPEALCGERTNCYHAPSRTIVMVPNQSLRVLAHEGCHAHQHYTVLEELGREPRLDMSDWLDTSEAHDYAAVVDGRPTEWRLSADNLIEDFAEGCARYMVGLPSTDARDTFFAERGFK